MFDAICPVSFAEQTSLCVILVIQSSMNLIAVDPKIVFRRFVEEYSRQFNEVSFMYVYNDYQPGFILPIEGEDSIHFHYGD